MDVGVQDALGGGVVSRIEHFVFQFHQPSHNATNTSVEQVVVGVRGLNAPVGKVFGRDVYMGVQDSTVSTLVDFNNDLACSVLVYIAVSVQAYIVIHCCYHGMKGFIGV